MGIHHFYNKKQHKDPLCDGKAAPEMLYYIFNGVMDPVFEHVLTPSHFWDYLLRGHSGPWRNFLSSSHPRLQGFVIWFKASSACQLLQPFPSQGARRAASFSHIARFKKWGVNLRHGLLREAVGYTALTCWRLNNQLWDYLSSDSTVQKKRKKNQCSFPSTLFLLLPGFRVTRLPPDTIPSACRIAICCGDTADESGGRELKLSSDFISPSERAVAGESGRGDALTAFFCVQMETSDIDE